MSGKNYKAYVRVECTQYVTLEKLVCTCTLCVYYADYENYITRTYVKNNAIYTMTTPVTWPHWIVKCPLDVQSQ